jgi:hypothetical protein
MGFGLMFALQLRCNQLGAKTREDADRMLVERGLATIDGEGTLTVKSVVVPGLDIRVMAPEVRRFLEGQ